MSWIRSALNKAAEAAGAGGKSLGPNFAKVRTYAGSVVQTAGNAVAGAKVAFERASGRHYNNFKHATKRLDEVSLNARGEERLQAFKRWLNALKDLEKSYKTSNEKNENTNDDASQTSETTSEENHTPTTKVFFYDSDLGNDPLTFRDVFLRSNALENITTSLILDAPSDEEVSMVLEMFGLCLSGGPELHNAMISGILDLAKANGSYGEMLLKREDLLRVAADAVSGLKISAEIEKLDQESNKINQLITEKLEKFSLENPPPPDAMGPSSIRTPKILNDLPAPLLQGIEDSYELFHLASRLSKISIKKNSLLNQYGDTEEIRTMKIEKMKNLASELIETAEKQKTSLTETKKQKQEALDYRVTKSQEVMETEKVISQEMQVLQKRREELETELNQVLQAIAVQTKKHIQLQEEKEQFDDATTNMLAHLSFQEKDLSTKAEQNGLDSTVVSTWKNFLEDSWKLQESCEKVKEKEFKESISQSRSMLWKVSITHLTYRQEELIALLNRLKKYASEIAEYQEKKESIEGQGVDEIAFTDIAIGRKKVEEKYVEIEMRINKSLLAVTKSKEEIHFLIDTSLKEEEEIKVSVEELLEKLSTIKSECEAVKRPNLSIEEIQIQKSKKPHVKSSESWMLSSVIPGSAVPSSSTKSEGEEKEKAADASNTEKKTAEQKVKEKDVAERKEKAAVTKPRSEDGEDNIDEIIREIESAAENLSEGEGDEAADGWDFDDLEESLKS